MVIFQTSVLGKLRLVITVKHKIVIVEMQFLFNDSKSLALRSNYLQARLV